MAPSTRLQEYPQRRIHYDAPTARFGSRGNPIEMDDTPPSVAVVAQGKARVPARGGSRKPAARVKSGAVVKPKEASKKTTKKAVPLKLKLPPPRRECSICASSKLISRSFRHDKSEDTCEHLKGICGGCIQRIVQEKVAGRQLNEPGLNCPYPECDHILEHATLKSACTNKRIFAEYDAALTQHHLSSNPNFIACLSPKCGDYFSIEDCTGRARKNSKQEVACPYCEYKLCLTCNRPWHSDTGCSEAAQKEDEASLNQIKSMGAKPCPKCGINIEKQGGCDHMTCHRCRHNFCWQCLVPFTGNVVHRDGCPHGHRNVAANPGNWAPDNATPAQINALIAAAQRRLDEGGFQVHAPHNLPLRDGPIMAPILPQGQQVPPPLPNVGFDEGFFQAILRGGLWFGNGGR